MIKAKFDPCRNKPLKLNEKLLADWESDRNRQPNIYE
jgi:hypothetical protein